MHVFLAGIMQGSRADELIGSQDYRAFIAEKLQTHVPGVKISDPYSLHPNSVDYALDQARDTFTSMTSLAADADVLIAYLPEASMGTAIEMWSARSGGTYIIAVTPLKHNWVVLVTADEIVPDLNGLIEMIEDGRIGKVLSR